MYRTVVCGDLCVLLKHPENAVSSLLLRLTDSTSLIIIIKGRLVIMYP